ncbi:hypothetical protein B0H19DRAFT_1160240 [Mycena capillaripes]|nr:hypothetical protein B0H19DRAFT_1160240 [Mycena capillaripes]
MVLVSRCTQIDSSVRGSGVSFYSAPQPLFPRDAAWENRDRGGSLSTHPYPPHLTMALLLSPAGVLLLTRARVSDQVASSAWNSNISVSTADRIRLAGAALDVAIDRLSADGLFDDEPYGIAGNLYSQMAQFDIATNQTEYATALAQYLQLQENMDKNFSDPYRPFVCSQISPLTQTSWDDLYRRITCCPMDTQRQKHMPRTRTQSSFNTRTSLDGLVDDAQYHRLIWRLGKLRGRILR